MYIVNNTRMRGNIFSEIEQGLLSEGFEFESKNFDKPWGGYFVIKEEQSLKFMEMYYPEEKTQNLTKGGKISPKILVVHPNKRLSWQYHFRRSEVWKVIGGRVGVIRSHTDEQGEMEQMGMGDKIILEQGERHRLVGLDRVGVIAEIWQHCDPNHPSNENDIIRLEDDFGR